MYRENVIIAILPDAFTFFFTLYYLIDYKESERLVLYENFGFERFQKKNVNQEQFD